MRNTVIARRYAKALLDLAMERKILDSIVAEVQSFDEALQTNAGFRRFLTSQDLNKTEKKAKLESALQDRISNIFFNFLLVLLKKNRESIFPDIAREFNHMVDQHHKRTRASATTAVPLDNKAISKLKTILDKAFELDVHVDNRVDESILGGIVVSVNGRLLDGSLLSQLQRLKGQLIGKTNLN